MVINLKQYKITFLIIGCFILFISIFKWIEYLTKNKYIVECFTSGNNANTNNANSNNQMNTSSTSHSVDLPLNSTSSCSNFCGPQSQCALTRDQCTSDVDCQGCQPKIDAPPKYLTTTEVKPLNDAGKLTWGQTPQYSSLTTDIGSEAAYAKPGSKKEEINRGYEGYDMWTKSFNYGLKLSNEKLTYADSETLNSADALILPQYPVTKTATGLFYDTGPNASNARL